MAFGGEGWTIGELIDREAMLEWRCRECGKVGRADPRRIGAAKGMGFRLMDQHPPCPTPDCLGRVVFSIGLGMRWLAQESTRARQWGLEASTYRESSTLSARGWRIAGGLWRPPHRRVNLPETQKEPPAGEGEGLGSDSAGG